MSNNMISGQIPASFGQFASLKDMRLDNNKLTGELPAELSGMKSIESLLLENNSLVGRVDQSICDLRDMNLETFVTDCPSQDGPTLVGVICPVASCCTSCID